jgi:hypothetical protein
MGLEKIHQAIVDGSVGIKTVVDYAAKIDSNSFESDASSQLEGQERN